MFVHYLKVALRNLWKHKSQTLITLFGLSVSLACFALCFSLVRGFLTMDKSYPDSDRMYSVINAVNGYWVSMPFIGRYVSESYPEIAKYTAYDSSDNLVAKISVNGQDKQYSFDFLEVTPSFCDFFSVEFVEHPDAGWENTPNGVLLFESAARKYFGANPVKGETLTLLRERWVDRNYVDVDVSYTICGVVKDFPANSYIRMFQSKRAVGMLFNDMDGRLNPANEARSLSTKTLVMLQEGTDVAVFNEKFKSFMPTIEETYYAGMIKRDDSLQLCLYSDFTKQSIGQLMVLLSVLGAIGLLVLLVALFNYVSYLMSMFLNKTHECGIRKSVNANQWQLFALFYTEIVLILLLAVSLSLFWLQLVLPSFNDNQMMQMLFPLEMSTLTRELVGYLIAGLAIAFVGCLLPVLKLNKSSVKDSLYGGKAKNPQSVVRSVLLGLQLFISILFAVLALNLYNHMHHIATLTAGTLTDTEKENIVELNFGYQQLSPHRSEIIDRIKTNPSVEDFLITDTELAGRGISMTKLTYNGDDIADRMSVFHTDHHFADFTHLPLLEGSYWEEGRTDAIVVNETAKKLLGKEDVLGEKIFCYNDEYTIVGVAKDVYLYNPNMGIVPTFYLASDRMGHMAYLKLNPKRKTETVKELYAIIREYLPETIDYRINSIDDNISLINLGKQSLFNLIFSFAIITIIISLFGVYSSVVLTTDRRRKEVALRKVNGARTKDILTLFLRTYLIILIVAAVPALLVARYLWQLLQAAELALKGYSWWLAFMVFGVVLVLLIVTITGRLVKTARENPADVVKSE